MSVIAYKGEKTTEKRVRFTAAATEILKAGYPFCYNHDYGTAADEEGQRAIFVEKPAAANLEHFAGWLKAEDAGKRVVSGGTYFLTIVVPQSRGQKIPVFTDLSCTINSTLLHITSGSWLHSDEGVLVGKAMQTIDRSTTNGTTLALLYGPDVDISGGSARSRTAVQLPTAAIWDNIPVAELRKSPFNGSLLEADFTHGEGLPLSQYVSATYAASAEGMTKTEYVNINAGVEGALDAFTTTDNQTVELQWPTPVTVSGGKKWGFEVRFKLSLIDDTKAKMALGLAKPVSLTGDFLTDAGAVVDGGFVGLHWKEADGNAIDFVYDETAQTQNEHDADYIVPVAAAYRTFGMYFNGTTIQGYVDGVLTGTAIVAADIAAADFPTAEVLVPTLAVKGAAGDDVTVSIDWIRVGQAAD